MMKILFLLTIILVPALLNAQVNKRQHQLFTEILQEYVKDGLVDYKNLKNDERLDKYLKVLTETNPDDYKTDEEKIAFYINAYNAYTLKFIVEEYPVESINDLHWGGLYLGSVLGTTVWDDKKVIINKKKFSLNNIEHDLLRKEFEEKRIHFALVCASLSCPQLRNEAFEGFKLDDQLNDQGITFFNDKSRNKFDAKTKTAYLSKILDWYDDDFGANGKEILLYITNFLSKGLAKDIRKEIDEWEIEYLSYNWDLNDLK